MSDQKKDTLKVAGAIVAVIMHFVLLSRMFNAVENRTVINEHGINQLREDARETKTLIREMNSAIQEIRDAVTAMEARDEVLRHQPRGDLGGDGSPQAMLLLGGLQCAI